MLISAAFFTTHPIYGKKLGDIMAGRKRLPFLLLKVLISLSILAFILIKQTSLREIGDVLRTVDWRWLALAFSLHAFGLFSSAYRWQILARAQGDEIPLGFLAKSYLVGQFFNNFLPTSFGGDIVRIWDGSRYSKSLVKSSAIVLVERFTGISVLFLMAVVGSLFRLEMAREIPVILAALLLGLLGFGLSAAFLTGFAARFLASLPVRGLPAKLRDKILLFRETILHYRTQKGPFARAIFWAFLLQLNVVVYYFLIGRALHLNIHFVDYFIFIPLVLIILTIPITISGLGLREESYIEIFKFYGISAQAAVSFSLIGVAFNLVIGL
ncbi:MAG: hypothetical protein A2W03_17485, partial [Candidatus Aminicenantes bacterium RBG_16_63_16]